MNAIYCMLGILLCWNYCVDETDLAALRAQSQACRGEGLRSLIGLSCDGETVVTGPNKKEIRRSASKGSFRSDGQWLVFTGPSRGEWNGVLVQNSDLLFFVNDPASHRVRMPDYQFGDQARAENLYADSAFFPSVGSGGNFFELSFYEFAMMQGFSASRMANLDQAEFGKCWSWSFPGDGDIPAYEGKIWIREFDAQTSVIGKIVNSRTGSPRQQTITHSFSKDARHPSLIERVETEEDGIKSVFRIVEQESENEAADGYTPEHFGLESPSNPANNRIWLSVAAGVFGIVALLLTLRYRKRSV